MAVLVSECVPNTVLMDGSASRRRSTSATGTACPQATSTVSNGMPYALQMLPQRSPNLPPTMHSAFAPGAIRFTTVASMAPVPDAASISTSPWVWWSQRKSSVTRLYAVRNTSVRWCGGTCDIARKMRTGISTGPGVNRRGRVDVIAGVTGGVTVMAVFLL